MKKLSLLAIAALLTLTPLFQSCLDSDTNEDLWQNGTDGWLAMSTIKTLEGVANGYYFGLDDGTKMYPGDTTSIHKYTVINGQRAFVYFNYLNESKADYDYNVKVEAINNILTKPIVELTTENAAAIGDDKINATRLWIAQDYLNIEFQYYGTKDENKKHFLNLVQNKTISQLDEEGYICLEFRHNSEGDSPTYLDEGYVSYKLDEIEEEMKTAKGLKIRVNTLYDGEQFRKVEFKKEQKAAFSLQQFQSATHTTKVIY